ncbi:hypothetical protein D5018_21045 [Parashewanella curva]|uniref:Uncharacterized protein n=1 Tax=Parashewanella curva TaxID=2338552 RepID=A0A3L8PUK7_9GAMM|nr:hypothetical protein [Parashewanella curva]RLV57722.1 hypothetical protein D5018_21045 [Parashewanella curva]
MTVTANTLGLNLNPDNWLALLQTGQRVRINNNDYEVYENIERRTIGNCILMEGQRVIITTTESPSIRYKQKRDAVKAGLCSLTEIERTEISKHFAELIFELNRSGGLAWKIMDKKVFDHAKSDLDRVNYVLQRIVINVDQDTYIAYESLLYFLKNRSSLNAIHLRLIQNYQLSSFLPQLGYTICPLTN